MTSQITVVSPQYSADELNISYEISLNNDIQEISCTIMGPLFPIWLRVRKFILMSQKKNSLYVPLFSEVNNKMDLDTTLFIDMVYARIMDKEKFKVSQS